MNVVRDKPVNGDFEKRIKHLLEYISKQPKNQKLTKRRIYELICEEGYKGSYSSFTYQARKIEEKLGINQKECKSQYHSVQKMENNNVQKIELRIRNV